MRSTLLVIMVLMLLGPSALLAQTRLDRYNFVRLGDSAEYHAFDATQVEPGPAGEGVVWDFSGLTRDPGEDFTIAYGRPDIAPNPQAYPGTEIVTKRVEGDSILYDYMQWRGERIYVLGSEVSDVGTFRFTDVSFFAGLNLNFNESNMGPIGGSYAFTSNLGPTGMSTLDGMTTAVYDGFGTLVLPDGTRVTGVHRVVTVREWEEQGNVGGVQVMAQQKETRYAYLQLDHSAPLFEFKLTEQTAQSLGNPPVMQVTREASLRVAQTSMPQLTARRGAHLTAPGGVFTTELIVHNPTDDARQLSLQPLDGDGLSLASLDLDLAANTSTRQSAENVLGDMAQSFLSSGCQPCSFTMGYRANIPNGSTAHVHQTREFGREFVFYPGEWEILFDGQALINVSDRNAVVSATQVDFQGQVLGTVTLETALAPGAKHLSLLNDQFTNNPDSLIKLTSDERLAVMVLRISNDFRFLYQNNPLPAFVDQIAGRWLPHITSDAGGFDTDILVHNRGDQSGILTFQPYDRDGQALSTVDVTVAPGATKRMAKVDLFPSETSHASVSGADHCIASVGYRAQQSGASTAVIHESAPLGQSFKVFPGEWSLLFDGVALINTGDGPATISLSQIADNGTTLNKVELVADLPANGKFLGLLEGLVPENGATLIQIDADQPVAVLSLRLSKDNLFLYNNEALP